MHSHSKPPEAAAQAELSVGRLAEWIDQTDGADLDVRDIQVMSACASLQLGCPVILLTSMPRRRLQPGRSSARHRRARREHGFNGYPEMHWLYRDERTGSVEVRVEP
jgi:hypothetical protein